MITLGAIVIVVVVFVAGVMAGVLISKESRNE
jgi:uncharacterized protein YneF (UPF0154 family)